MKIIKKDEYVNWSMAVVQLIEQSTNNPKFEGLSAIVMSRK